MVFFTALSLLGLYLQLLSSPVCLLSFRKRTTSSNFTSATLDLYLLGFAVLLTVPTLTFIAYTDSYQYTWKKLPVHRSIFVHACRIVWIL